MRIFKSVSGLSDVNYSFLPAWLLFADCFKNFYMLFLFMDLLIILVSYIFLRGNAHQLNQQR